MLNRFQDVFRCLQQNEVRYLVIGGIAAILHGVPRATFDLDLLMDATPENGDRLLRAFREAGLPTASLTSVGDLLRHEITIFRDRVRIDVQTRTPGIDFASAWERKETVFYGDQAIYLVCKADLIASSRAAGRPVDLEDVRLLELGSD